MVRNVAILLGVGVLAVAATSCDRDGEAPKVPSTKPASASPAGREPAAPTITLQTIRRDGQPGDSVRIETGKLPPQTKMAITQLVSRTHRNAAILSVVSEDLRATTYAHVEPILVSCCEAAGGGIRIKLEGTFVGLFYPKAAAESPFTLVSVFGLVPAAPPTHLSNEQDLEEFVRSLAAEASPGRRAKVPQLLVKVPPRTELTWALRVLTALSAHDGGAIALFVGGAHEGPDVLALPVRVGSVTGKSDPLNGLWESIDMDAQPGPPCRFFGTGGNAHHIVFVVDRSQAMTDQFDLVRHELLKAVSRLRPDQSFDVLLFAGDTFDESPARRLVSATAGNKRGFTTYLREAEPGGGSPTDPTKAIQQAFDVLGNPPNGKKGKILFLLAGGEFHDREAVRKQIKSLNKSQDVQVYTILYTSKSEAMQQVLGRIAQDNRGRFKFVQASE